jgi:rubrerythrin
MKVFDVLQLAQKMELNGMEFYNEQRDRVKLPVLKELFSFLSDMERGHAEYLERQMQNVKEGRDLSKLPGDTGEDRYRAIMDKQKVETNALDSDLGDYSIMRMAYLIEKDFAEFYDKSAEQSDGEIKILFQTLSEWEKGHASMMKEEMGRILSRNAIDIGFYPF